MKLKNLTQSSRAEADVSTELTILQCGNCGVFHAIPKAMHDTCLEEGGYWHCPNGHCRGYKEGRREKEAIRLERDRLKQRVAQIEDELRAEKLKADRAAERSKAGLCPCCNRSFTNMARHMATKHPEAP